MKTIELLNILNELRAGLGHSPLKNWKQSRAKLEERIEEAKAQLKAEREQRVATKTEEPKAAEPKARKITVASVVKPMILSGMSNEEIAAKVAIEMPELLGEWDNTTGGWKQTKQWYITWYRAQMKRKGEL